MQPILFDRFRHILAEQGASAVRSPATRLDYAAEDEIFYIPFEHVNHTARIAIVGITPGPNQIRSAYCTAQRLLRDGAPEGVVLAEAKREGSFGSSTMRPNLVRILDEFGFQELLGLPSCAALWANAFDYLHATSTIPHAAFRKGKPFAGSFAEIMRSRVFRRGFEEHFVPSLRSLPQDALYVALGPTPLAALDWCANRGFIKTDQVLGALPHPSTSGGSQVDVFLGKKGIKDLTDGDPVIRRIPALQARARRVREAVTRLRGTSQPVQPAAVLTPMFDTAPSAPSRAAARKSPPTASAVEKPSAKHVEPAFYTAFERAGFRCVKDSAKKVTLFASAASGQEVYLINDRSVITVVVHPKMLVRARMAVREPSSSVSPALFHHSNLGTFPNRDNGGQRPIRYGVAVTCQSIDALRDFLVAFDVD